MSLGPEARRGESPAPGANIGPVPGAPTVENAPAVSPESTPTYSEGFQPFQPAATGGSPQVTAPPVPTYSAGFSPVTPEMLRPPINPAPSAFRQRLQQAGDILDRMREAISFQDSFERGTKESYEAGKAQAATGLDQIMHNMPASGVGNIFWGGLGVIGAPIAGLAKPIEEQATKITGDPVFGSKAGFLATLLFGKPGQPEPLFDAGAGNLGKVMRGPDGTLQPQIVGKYPPMPEDFENAARNIVGSTPSKAAPERLDFEGMRQRLHDAWEEQGLHPAEVAERVKDDPVMAHDLSAARSPVLPLPDRPAPQFIKEMDDKFYRLRGAATADKEELLQRLQALPDSIKNPEVQELWYRYMEGDRTVEMPPELGKQYNDIMGPLKVEEARLWEDAKRTDLDVQDLNPNYAHRIVKGKNPEIDRLAGEGAETNPIYNGSGLLKRTTSSMEQRKFYALEDAAGNRQVVAVNKDGDLVTVAKGRATETVAKEFTKDNAEVVGRTVKAADREWTVTHALTNEIEGATNVEYYKNALANTIDNILHLRSVNRAIYTVQTIRDTPEWAAYTARRGTEGIPSGWRTPELSLFQNDVMHPYLAEVLDDFYGRRFTDGLSEALYKANRMAVGSLFWTPIPHIGNAGAHWVLERSWDWITPGGLKSLAVDGATAIRSVVRQDATYQRMLRDGSALIYGGIANQNFYEKMLRETGMRLASDPEFASIAAITKLRPDRLVGAMYATSRNALWAVSDMFMVQRILELEGKGMATREAIAAAEAHMPNYRLPSRILGSRSLQQAFGNPFFFNFSRYHYGVLKGYASMATELVSGDPEKMIHATGAIMAFGVLQLALYPALSALLQKITDDPGFSVPSYGPGRLARPVIGSVVAAKPDAFPEFVKNYYKDNPDFLQQLSNMLVFAPVANFATETFNNQYNFTGRKITEPADWRRAQEEAFKGNVDAQSWENIARTQGEHAAESMFLPYNTINQAWRKGLDPGTAMIQALFGVQYNTPEQESAKNRAFRYQDKEAVKRERKPIGLIEGLGR